MISPSLPVPRTLQTRWYCGYYVGPSHWQRSGGDWVNEPAECETEWDEEVDEEAWMEKLCTSYCPSCGALHWQSDEPAEVIDNP